MADATQPEHVGGPNETACARVWFFRWTCCMVPLINRPFSWGDGGPHCRDDDGTNAGACAPEMFAHDLIAFGAPYPVPRQTCRRGTSAGGAEPRCAIS
jgi:hypothetical protein